LNGAAHVYTADIKALPFFRGFSRSEKNGQQASEASRRPQAVVKITKSVDVFFSRHN
jgi:hypothetical protein